MNNTWYFPHENLPGNVAQGYYDLYNNDTLVNVTNIATGGMFSNLFISTNFLTAYIERDISFSGIISNNEDLGEG